MKIYLKIFCLSILLIFVVNFSVLAIQESIGGTITLRAMLNVNESSTIVNRIEGLENDYNIKFKIKDVEFQQGMRNLLGALRERRTDWNLIVTRSDNLPGYILQQTLHPLNEYIGKDYYNNLPQSLQPLEKGVTFDGNIYGIPTQTEFASGYPFDQGHIIIWNRELFRKKGLPDLDDLQERGEWTWEKMTEIAREATKDTTNDGNIDLWGLGGLVKDQFRMLNLIEAYGAPVFEVTEDGSFEFKMANKRTIEALNYFYKWNTEYEIVHPAPNNQRDDRAAFENGEMAMFVHCMFMHNFINTEENDFGLAYFPKHPDMENYIMPVPFAPVTGIPIIEENPGELVKIHDEIFKPEDVNSRIDEVAAKIDNSIDRDRYKEMVNNWRLSQFNLVPTGLLSQVDALNYQEDPAAISIEQNMREIEKIITGEVSAEELMTKLDREFQELLYKKKRR